MNLIIGGAYQGKLEYARERFGLLDEDICLCSEDRPPDLSKKCLYHVEQFVMLCMKNGQNPALELSVWRERHKDGLLICEDIFCGVVPTDQQTRLWREAAGRFMSWAAREAESVTRVFCGLPQKLK